MNMTHNRLKFSQIEIAFSSMAQKLKESGLTKQVLFSLPNNKSGVGLKELIPQVCDVIKISSSSIILLPYPQYMIIIFMLVAPCFHDNYFMSSCTTVKKRRENEEGMSNLFQKSKTFPGPLLEFSLHLIGQTCVTWAFKLQQALRTEFIWAHFLPK